MTYRLSGRLLNKGLMGAVVALLLLMSLLVPARAELVQFVYTSDQHYGITRKAFRGLDKVSSREVIRFPGSRFPRTAASGPDSPCSGPMR